MKFINNPNIKFTIILFVIFVSAAEIDICVPSFPQIQNEFGLSPFKTEALLGASLLFHCIAALYAGTFGDKYGKKTAINAGFVIFISGSLLCFLAPGYNSLIAGRILQGIGISGPLVLAPIIILDLYEKEKQQKMMSLLNGFVTLAVCIAPVIGSYSTLLFDWRANFLLLTLLGLFAFVIFNMFIPNDESISSNVRLSIKDYGLVFKSREAVLYIVGLAFCVGAYYTFVGMASIIYVDSFGVSLKKFGIYQGLLTFTFGIVSIFSGSIIRKLGKKIAFSISLALMAAFLLSCLLTIIFNVQNPNYITAIILLLSAGVVIPCNMMYVLGLDSIAGASGKISGLITTGKWLFTIVGIQTASYFYTHDFRSTGFLMFIMELVTFIILVMLIKRNKKFHQEVYSNV